MFNLCKQFNCCSVLGTFPGMFPATNINMVPVAVIIIPTQVTISHAKAPPVSKKVRSSMVCKYPGVNAFKD